MPRSPRFVVPGVPLHIIQRGNNRSVTFFAAEDYDCYRDALCTAGRLFDCAVHAYVLMTNHVHLLITPEEVRGPSRMMQAVGRRFVSHINRRHHRTGTLWEGRFRSALVDSEHYLLVCSRYIELNPVRAGMVQHPGQYRWSSYRHNAYGEPDALITPHASYDALGSVPTDRQTGYQALFQGELEPQTLDAVRRSAHAGRVLGNTRFREHVEAALRRRVTQARGSPRGRAAHGGRREDRSR